MHARFAGKRDLVSLAFDLQRGLSTNADSPGANPSKRFPVNSKTDTKTPAADSAIKMGRLSLSRETVRTFGKIRTGLRTGRPGAQQTNVCVCGDSTKGGP